MVVLDLFSGAGGLTEGFYKEGFKVIAHVEKEKWACETLKTRRCFYYLKEKQDFELYYQYLRDGRNYKKIDEAREIIFNKYLDLKKTIDFEVINKAFGNPAEEEGVASTEEIITLIEKSMEYNNEKKIDIIIGGPPCQAYSVIGRARMKEKVVDDKRNYLFYYYKDLVNYFKPKVFVFENVPGILTAKNGDIFEQIQREFTNIGYKLLSGKNKLHKDNILNSKDFGVYQNRKRVILLGIREDLNLDYPDFHKYKKNFNEDHNTKNAIGDLSVLKPGYGDDFQLFEYPKTDKIMSEYQKYMRENSIGIINSKVRTIKDFDKKIYKIAIEKKSRGEQLYYYDLPDEVKNHSNQKTFSDRFKVHWWEDIPHTIVAHISRDGHYNIHPDIEQCRSLTVREAARIQSFPDNFKFEGPRTWQFVQVGNAVPPLMGQAIAKSIKRSLSSIK